MQEIQQENLVVVCQKMDRVTKRALGRKSPISMGSNGEPKQNESLNLTEHIRNKQDSFQYIYFDIQEAKSFKHQAFY